MGIWMLALFDHGDLRHGCRMGVAVWLGGFDGSFTGLNGAESNAFTAMADDSLTIARSCTGGGVALIIIFGGVKSGIERAVVMIPLLLLLLIGLAL